jgi:hypothetical protein
VRLPVGCGAPQIHAHPVPHIERTVSGRP